MLRCPTEQAHNSATEGDKRPVWEVDRVDDIDAGGPIERRTLCDAPRRIVITAEPAELLHRFGHEQVDSPPSGPDQQR